MAADSRTVAQAAAMILPTLSLAVISDFSSSILPASTPSSLLQPNENVLPTSNTTYAPSVLPHPTLHSLLTTFHQNPILISIFIFPIVYIILKAINNLVFHPLSAFPGPILSRISSLPNLFNFYTTREHQIDYSLSLRYGPIVRKAPNLLLVSDPALLPLLYHRNVEKGSYYSPITADEDVTIRSMFHTVDAKAHSKAKRRVAAGFGGTAIKGYREIVERSVERWVAQIGKRVDSGYIPAERGFRTEKNRGATIDWAAWACYLAYDTITEVCFGEPFGFIETGSDVGGLIACLEQGMPAGATLMRSPRFLQFLRRIGVAKWLLPAPKEDDKGIGRILKVTNLL